MVVLLDREERGFTAGGPPVSRLAELGVTSMGVFRDADVVGVVLEGWLFDPETSGDAAAAALGVRPGVRTLHPVMHMAVSTTNRGGRE